MSEKDNKILGINNSIWIVIIIFALMLLVIIIILPWLLELSPNMEGGTKLLQKNYTKFGNLAILIIISSFLVLVNKIKK